jgi:hypothetical protein
MPAPGAVPPAISPEAIKRMLLGSADPSALISPDVSAPGAAPTPPPATTPGAPPASGAIAQNMPLQQPEDKSQYLSEHPAALPARPTGDFDTGKHPAVASGNRWHHCLHGHG